MNPGTVFNLKAHKEQEGLDIFVCEEPDDAGKEFWLSKGFVLGQFEDGYKPLCWTQDLFIVI